MQNSTKSEFFLLDFQILKSLWSFYSGKSSIGLDGQEIPENDLVEFSCKSLPPERWVWNLWLSNLGDSADQWKRGPLERWRQMLLAQTTAHLHYSADSQQCGSFQSQADTGWVTVGLLSRSCRGYFREIHMFPPHINFQIDFHTEIQRRWWFQEQLASSCAHSQAG